MTISTSPQAEWLKAKASNFTSQFGEDGIIAAIIERIGEAGRWCVECGAADGSLFSNTMQWRNKGWNCLLIESDLCLYNKCTAFESDNVHVMLKTVGTGNDGFDAIFAEYGIPEDDLDLLVIDVDGQDYYLFDGLKCYRPRVLMCEFKNGDYSDTIPPLNGEGQAGYAAIAKLGEAKGYVAVAVTQVNIIFVRADLAEKVYA